MSLTQEPAEISATFCVYTAGVPKGKGELVVKEEELWGQSLVRRQSFVGVSWGNVGTMEESGKLRSPGSILGGGKGW